MGQVFALILVIFPAVMIIREMIIFRKVRRDPGHPNYNIYKEGYRRRLRMGFLLMFSVALIQVQELIPSTPVQIVYFLFAVIMIILCLINVLKEMQSIGKHAINEHTKLSIDSIKNIHPEISANPDIIKEIVAHLNANKSENNNPDKQ